MPKAAYKSKRIPLEFKTDAPCAERGHSIQPLLSAFAFLVSLREELRARKDTVTRAACNAALVDAIAAEDDDGYDCIELEAMHAAQRAAMHRARRRGTAKHGAQR